MKQSRGVLGSISGLYWLVTQIGLKKGKKPLKWDMAHISPKMSLLMVRMAWYDKNIWVYEISILKMTIFYIQNCLWQETPIFDLWASNSSWANAAAEMLDSISLEGTHMTQFAGNHQKWPTLLLEKCGKNIIFWIFWGFKIPIFMKISIYWPSMIINIDSLCLEYLSNLFRDQKYALSYWGWPKIVLDGPKFEPQTTLFLLDLIRFQ